MYQAANELRHFSQFNCLQEEAKETMFLTTLSRGVTNLRRSK